jgi:hypothetical protein
LGLPDNGPDKDSIENKMPFILYMWAQEKDTKMDLHF